ncbi:MAG: hypothetical protein OEW59_09135 [Gammaproteobacteria bacterium]|nr:hypothetical protein [Gammaproteobacteria bacterium]
MTDILRCYRCGATLEALSLPLSRRDECPDCTAPVHVCRMCVFYDKSVPKQCREDDAEEVSDKEKANFCEWYEPSATVFDPARLNAASRARADLVALFGEEACDKPATDELTRAAEDLFK